MFVHLQMEERGKKKKERRHIIEAESEILIAYEHSQIEGRIPLIVNGKC